MGRKDKTRAPRSRLIVTLLAASLTLVAVHIYISDIWKARLFGEETVYADGYSEKRFQSIKVGMKMAEVDSIMGPPLRRGTWGDLRPVWFYSDQRNVSDNFWRRWVVVDATSDRVAEIIADFWVD
jgi:hypothetical protein